MTITGIEVPEEGHMSVYLKRKVDERKGLTAAITGLYETAGKADRDLNEGEKAQVSEMEKRCAVLDEEIERFTKTAAATQKFMGFAGTAQEAEDEAERRKAADHPDDNAEQRGRSLTYARERFDFGKTFVESDAFKSYEGRGSSKAVTLPGPASPEFRAAISTADFEHFVTETWAGPPGPAFTTPLLDLLGREQLSTSSTVWLRWPEATDAGEVAEGAPKPEAELEPEEVPIALRTFAHWKPITRQALEDVDNIQTIVQNKLLRGVLRKLQSAAATAIASSGTGIQAVTAPDLLSGVRTAIALLESEGYEPNAIGLNPNDAADLDLAAMQNTVAGAVRTGGAWGVRYAPAAAFPAGTLYVGDFSQAVTWFDRGNTQAYITDSHADFFIRNQLVILAEARANFAVTEAPAIVKVTVGAGD